MQVEDKAVEISLAKLIRTKYPIASSMENVSDNR